MLLPLSALPGPAPIGDLGPSVDRWLEWLAEAKQSLWQLLPLGTTTAIGGYSPYSALSAFAIDPIYIGLESLVTEGLLTETPRWSSISAPSGYAEARADKAEPLRRAFEAWTARGGAAESAYQRFVDASSSWLPDYALYMALRDRFGRAWFDWPAGLRDRDPSALAQARETEAEKIAFELFLQYVADRQWQAVRRRGRELGVELFGDLPIYVAWDSADVWVERSHFRLDRNGKPEAVAGVPPDYFSETGQRWGHPLFRWDDMARDGYRWWIDRLRRNARLFDRVRLDHFRGFASYWEIPASESDAVAGRWVDGPGAPLLRAVADALPELRLVAEDLGLITDEVRALRREVGIPGMRVLQFGFGEGFPHGEHVLHQLERDTVLYTGTHDNNTLVGWYADELSEEERERVERYVGRSLTAKTAARELCRLALSSVADVVILPVQDVLALGADARVNTPGTTDGNWSWRTSAEVLTAGPPEELRMWTETYGRTPRDDEEESAGAEPDPALSVTPSTTPPAA